MMTKKLKIVRDGHGGILRGGARPLPTTRVATVIRNELRAALDVEPFGVAALASVERVAKAGRALLLATSSDIAQQIAATAINTRSRAYRDGYKDGLAWNLDGYDSRDSVRRDGTGWDESTIQAMGIKHCEKQWGVDHSDDDAWNRACDEYNAGCQSGATAPQSRRTGIAPGHSPL